METCFPKVEWVPDWHTMASSLIRPVAATPGFRCAAAGRNIVDWCRLGVALTSKNSSQS